MISRQLVGYRPGVRLRRSLLRCSSDVRWLFAHRDAWPHQSRPIMPMSGPDSSNDGALADRLRKCQRRTLRLEREGEQMEGS